LTLRTDSASMDIFNNMLLEGLMKKPYPIDEPILQGTSQARLIQAYEENTGRFLRSYSIIPGVELHEEAGLSWLNSTIPVFFINSIWGSRLDESAAETAIQAAVERGQNNAVDVIWWITPSDLPLSLAENLKSRGWFCEYMSGMVMDLSRLAFDPAQSLGLSIQKVDSDAARRAWTQVYIQGFGLGAAAEAPILTWLKQIDADSSIPICNYLVSLDQEPVAVSSMILASGVAGIWNVTTLEGARRKGAGTVATAAALRDAQAAGYRFAGLSSSDMGKSIYTHLGFEEFCRISGHIALAPVKKEGG
jgi:hypothetical protein